MKNCIFFILLFGSLNTFSQQAQSTKIENLLGIQARLIDLMPFEISYIRLNNKWPSFAIRGGYGWGRKNETTTSTNNINTIPHLYNVNFYYNYGRKFTLEQTFEAIFIKPGIIFLKKNGTYFTNCLLFNYNIAKSFDKLYINSQDQLYGNVENVYYENHIYQSIEFEGNHQIELIRKVKFGMGYVFGYKIQNQFPFENQIKGIEMSSQYSPSQGVGSKAYVNLLVGVMYCF
jgi:hypothetical protein